LHAPINEARLSIVRTGTSRNSTFGSSSCCKRLPRSARGSLRAATRPAGPWIRDGHGTCHFSGRNVGRDGERDCKRYRYRFRERDSRAAKRDGGRPAA
jgi:hypothetical protein